ncbi:putative cytochrome P450 12a5 [Nymphaea thermarum]|nr:putative cytochrome P450 12a5 [Nymphaea thermarum]
MAAIAQAWSWWWRASNDQDATARSVLTILIVVFVLLWHAFRPKKRLPPGPPAWPLFGNLLGLPPNLHEHFTQLSRRYGPMIRVRLGSKLAVVVNSPSIAEEILKDQDLVFANRDVPLVAMIINYNGNDVVWGPYGQAWRLLRRVCVRELLNSVSLDMLYEVRRSEVRRLLAGIRAKSGAPVNIGEQVSACALDAITTMLWGGSIVDEEGGGKAAAETKRLIGEINELLGVPNDLVVGGTDTTSNTVEWAMTELLKNPTVMRRAQQEIEVAVGRDQHVEESHLTKLPYLGAVIKEVLRLHPILPLLVPHSPSSPCKVAGFDIPEGTSVMFIVWSIHRGPKYWDNPSVLDPERFLRQPDLDFSGRDFRYIPFGSGRRICVGNDIAERMVALILASVIHSFDWHVVEGEKIDTDEKFGIVLKKANPLSAIPSSRSLNPELCI